MIRACVVALAVAVIAGLASGTAHADWPHDPYSGGIGVCTTAGSQELPSAIADGSGGTFVAWTSSTSGGVFVQHLNARGVALWAVNGVSINVNEAHHATLVLDGTGGVVVAWEDYRSSGKSLMYAQRINAAGVPQWAANGVLLMSAGSGPSRPYATNSRIATDGAGGAILTWMQAVIVDGITAVRAQRVSSAGARMWGTNGTSLSLLSGEQIDPVIASDAAGGAYVAWTEQRTNYYLYAQRFNSLGVPQWTANGITVAVPIGGSGQFHASMVSDGAGRALLAWADARTEGGVTTDIWAQALDAVGNRLWSGSGNAVCQEGLTQDYPSIAADGAGGAFIAWEDRRSSVSSIHAQHVLLNSTHAWTLNGLLVAGSSTDKIQPRVIADATSGMIVAWSDLQDAYGDIRARRVNSSGALVPAAGPVDVANAPDLQTSPVIAADALGGAVIVWADYRTGDNDIRAERFDGSGVLGDPSARITRVRDLVGDQGGRVKVSWNASFVDDAFAPATFDYQVFRRVGAGAWTLSVTMSAGPVAQYSAVVATAADSGASNPYTQFMVRARIGASGSDYFWDSPVDSGYSVDNIAPAALGGMDGRYADGVTHLSWTPCTDADLAGYVVYRGASAEFVPSASSRVGTTHDSHYTDESGAAWVYKVTAIDAHGNESAAVIFTPGAEIGVIPAGAAVLFAPRPNPARELATIRYLMLRAGRAALVICDVSGRVVRGSGGELTVAGEHAVVWDLRDAVGAPVPAGLYFTRLEVDGVVSGRGRAVVVR